MNITMFSLVTFTRSADEYAQAKKFEDEEIHPNV